MGDDVYIGRIAGYCGQRDRDRLAPYSGEDGKSMVPFLLTARTTV
jgi:hypothetical protein